MSWDVYISIDTGSDEYATIWSGNHTWNIAPMFYKAFESTGNKEGLRSLDGQKCSVVTSVIQMALDHMKNNPDEYEILNPKNGWGSYESAMGFLGDILENCVKHPLCTIFVH